MDEVAETEGGGARLQVERARVAARREAVVLRHLLHARRDRDRQQVRAVGTLHQLEVARRQV